MKKIVIGTLAAAIVLGGSIGTGTINYGHAEEDNVKAKTVQGKKLIGTKKAKAVALKKVKGTVEDVDLEKEDGKTYYEVDIEQKNKEYEVYVDAYSAKILKVEKGWDDDDRYEKVSKSAKKSIISEKQAISIAKKKVNGKVIEIEKDDDDGRYKYEIKLRTTKGEAEIKIDAVTGKVLKVEFDD